MCCLIIKPQGVALDKEEAHAAFQANHDGAGFVAHRGDRLYLRKGYFEFEKFWAAFEMFQDDVVMTHFRLCSQGAVSVDNCHPYRLAGGHYLAHNGHMAQFTLKDDVRSDTKVLCDEVISPLLKKAPDALYSEHILAFLQMSFFGQKVAIMRRDGEVLIFNKSSWTLYNGCYFSNRLHAYNRIACCSWTDNDGLDDWVRGEDGIYRRRVVPTNTTNANPNVSVSATQALQKTTEALDKWLEERENDKEFQQHQAQEYGRPHNDAYCCDSCGGTRGYEPIFQVCQPCYLSIGNTKS